MSQRDLALQLTGLCREFDGLSVLHGVELHVSAGERLGIVGPNGAGKSTILRGIAGWIRPDQGTIRMLGEDVSRWPIHRRFSLGLRELPQFPDYSLELTGAQTIAAARWAVRRNGSNSHHSPPCTPTCRFDGLVSDIELRTPLRDLSFGSRKMVGLAAVLASKPKLLLLDEPTAGLDDEQRDAVARALMLLGPECAIVIVEHDLDFIRRVSGRLVELRDRALHAYDQTTGSWT